MIDEKPVLHIAEEGNRLSTARFVREASTKTIWSTILEYWALIHTGLPNPMLADQGSYSGSTFAKLGTHSSVEVHRTLIEAHSSRGADEKYHQPLINTYGRIKIAHPRIDSLTALAASVEAMNDTLGFEGPVPSALVLGEFAKAYSPFEAPDVQPTLEKRAQMATSARKKMEKQMAPNKGEERASAQSFTRRRPNV